MSKGKQALQITRGEGVATLTFVSRTANRVEHVPLGEVPIGDAKEMVARVTTKLLSHAPHAERELARVNKIRGLAEMYAELAAELEKNG